MAMAVIEKVEQSVIDVNKYMIQIGDCNKYVPIEALKKSKNH